MKQGRTLSELAKEIERQTTMKQDYIASKENYSMTESGKIIELTKDEWQTIAA